MNHHTDHYNFLSSNGSSSTNDTPKSTLTSARSHLAHVQKILQDVKEHAAASGADVSRRKLCCQRSNSPMSGVSIAQETKQDLRDCSPWVAPKRQTDPMNWDLKTLELEIFRLTGERQNNSAAKKTGVLESLLICPRSEVSSSHATTPAMFQNRQANHTNDLSRLVTKAPENNSTTNRDSLLSIDWLAQIRENKCQNLKREELNPSSENCKFNRCFGGKTTMWSNVEGPTSSFCHTRFRIQTRRGENRHTFMLKRSRSDETSDALNTSSLNRKMPSTLLDNKKKLPMVLRRNKSTHELRTIKKVTFTQDSGNGRCKSTSPDSPDLRTSPSEPAPTYPEVGNYIIKQSVPSSMKKIQERTRTMKYRKDGAIGAVNESIPIQVILGTTDQKAKHMTQTAPRPKDYTRMDDESVLSLFSIVDTTMKDMPRTIMTIAESNVNAKIEKNDSRKIFEKSLGRPLSRRNSTMSSRHKTSNSSSRHHTFSRRWSDVTCDHAWRNITTQSSTKIAKKPNRSHEGSFAKLVERSKKDKGLLT
eukprot:CCRYP_011999-RA/>CCRYP_011999-RA protein AED:0.09 eAED:0.09 QI:0/-1/0/1/-1/1/1/0/531